MTREDAQALAELVFAQDEACDSAQFYELARSIEPKLLLGEAERAWALYLAYRFTRAAESIRVRKESGA